MSHESPPSRDAHTTITTLRDMIAQFVAERDWQQFHAPKNISMALAVEAAELMEHFQWLTIEQSRAVTEDPETLDAVAEELADVICYALALANELQLDVSSAMHAKMEKNRAKYPADRYRGKWQA